MARKQANNSKQNKKGKQQPEGFVAGTVSWIKTIIWAIVVVMFINGALLASFTVPTPSMADTVMPGDFLFVNKFIYGPTTPQIIPFVNIPLPFYKFPGPKDPEQGDVIVFIYPGDYTQLKSDQFTYYLKRCIASAGDTLHIINKQVFVNQEKYELPEHGKYDLSKPDYPAYFPPQSGFTRDNYGPIRIPAEGDTIQITPQNFRKWNMFIQREGHDVAFNGKSILIDGVPTNSYIVERDYCFGMGDNRDNSSDSRFWGFIPYDNVVGTPMITYWSWDKTISIFNVKEKFKSIRFDRFFNIIR
jgi:signal peptidase I